MKLETQEWSKQLLALKCRSFAGALQVAMHPRTTGLAYVQPQYADVACAVQITVACPATAQVGTGKPLALARAKMQTDVLID